jgi:hypothetical protein
MPLTCYPLRETFASQVWDLWISVELANLILHRRNVFAQVWMAACRSCSGRLEIRGDLQRDLYSEFETLPTTSHPCLPFAWKFSHGMDKHIVAPAPAGIGGALIDYHQPSHGICNASQIIADMRVARASHVMLAIFDSRTETLF